MPLLLFLLGRPLEYYGHGGASRPGGSLARASGGLLAKVKGPNEPNPGLARVMLPAASKHRPGPTQVFQCCLCRRCGRRRIGLRYKVLGQMSEV